MFEERRENMGRNLLFVNKHREIISEFLREMAGKEIQIDTAEDGAAAAALLKRREYQVLVTGLTMEGCNGEQLITYVNETYPNTVCIIYTTNVSAAQLHFFINKRNVFRVFLRPMNFHMEFMGALEEAFEYYEIKVRDNEKKALRQEKQQEYKERMEELERRLENQRHIRGEMVRYMRRLTIFSLKEYTGDRLSPEEEKRLEKFELGLIELCCKNEEEALQKAEKAVLRIGEVVR